MYTNYLPNPQVLLLGFLLTYVNDKAPQNSTSLKLKKNCFLKAE